MIVIIKVVILILINQSLGREISELSDRMVVKLWNNISSGANYIGLRNLGLGLYNATDAMQSFRITKNKQNI
jgi:hypothetical protein